MHIKKIDYISVSNWDKYQHYKDRNAPWVKLYHSLLDSYEYSCLQDDSKLLLITFYMLAVRKSNLIPHDLNWINQKTTMNKKISKSNINELLTYGFIEIKDVDSNVIASCEQNACLEGEGEGEGERDYLSNSDEFRLSDLLYQLMLKNNPKAKKPNLQSWSKHIDLAIRVDNRSPDEIEKVIRWCQKDDFWSANILSTKKLRKQFDQLWIKMGQENNDSWKDF